MVSRLVHLLVSCLLSIGAVSAPAQTATRPLSAIRPASGAAAAAHALIVELSPREALSGVHLHLATNVAPPAGARYVVWVNGVQATQVAADGLEHTIALSPRAFVPGINSIQLALVPRLAPIAAETASSYIAPLDDARSFISLDFAGLRPNPAPTLAQLPVAFDRRAWMPRTVTVEFGRLPAPEQLRAAALAIQGIAARMRQVDITAAYERKGAFVSARDPASWHIDDEAARAGDVLLVGPRDALTDMLPSPVARAITGPFLGVYSVDEGKSLVIVLSGVTDADYVRAAQAFAETGTVLPARSAIQLDAAAVVHPPQSHLAISLEEPNSALVQAALNFAAIHVKRTDVLTDFSFTSSIDDPSTRLFFGSATALDTRRLRQLPIFPPLRPGQAVSLPDSPDSPGGQGFTAIVGSGPASVARAIAMLRKPAVWSLFNSGATLFDTTAGSAQQLEAAKRSPVARLRLLLAVPEVFWSVLVGLLALSYVFVNVALKAQAARRFDLGNRSSVSSAPPKR
jgi:hypothetical protein